ncbi:MAG TPA: DUF2750 domain-containing protein [Cytophagaceae bacterium]|jgi:hypothetical protein
MALEEQTFEEKHHKFIERVSETGVVWGLSFEDGWATCESNDFEDAEVIPFWSDEDLAKVIATDEWKHYQTTEITLSEFLENWLLGMHDDELLAGTNWDENLMGQETEPVQLALEIIEHLISINKKIEFEEFENLREYKAHVLEMMGDE